MQLILVVFLQNEAEEELEGVELTGLRPCCDSEPEPGTETGRFSPIAALSIRTCFVHRDSCWGAGPQENGILLTVHLCF